MALMIPDTYPASTPPGEREVFERLRQSEGTEEWVVIHSLEIAKHCQRLCGELDFVVFVPHLGILCLEVKSHQEIRRSHQGWYFGRNPKPEIRGPFRQASEGMHSIRNYLVDKAPFHGSALFISGVCFPFCRFEVESAEWDPWQVIDMGKFRRSPLPRLIEYMLRSAADKMESRGFGWIRDALADFTPAKIRRIVEIIRPSFEVVPSAHARVSCLEAELNHYTEQQFRALDLIGRNPRVVFTGPAGTGKTLVSIEAALRYKRTAPGSRVVWVCFNRNLMEWISNNSVLKEAGVEIRSLHSWMLSVAKLSPSDSGNNEHFWTRFLPEAAINKLIENAADSVGTVDFLVIDESQDLVSDQNLDFLELMLRAGFASGRWMMFGDFELQDIYRGADRSSFAIETLNGRCPPVTRCELTVNCRNRPRIAYRAQTLAKMDPGYASILRADDQVEPRFQFYQEFEQQVEMLAKILTDLRGENFRAQDIVILSTIRASAATALVTQPKWSPLMTESMVKPNHCFRYGTIHGFKGLEAPVVILTDLKQVRSREDAMLLYTGLTRSVDRFYALAHRDARENIISIITDLRK
jgi:hypothetical protein